MNFLKFIEATSPDTLQKLAEEAQDELVDKVISQLIPLMEKQANYTAYLILEKLAEGEEVNTLPARETVETPEVAESTQTGGGKDNSTASDGSKAPGGLRAQDVKDAISQAIEAQQADKIVPFVQQLSQQYPDAFKEVIKMVKVELQDGIMKNFIEADQAAAISDQINAMIGE